MAYEVLARKWRPQQFDAVVGQDHVTRTLRNAIDTGRIAHAYLFVGPRGVGKTSIARIMAKALNCMTNRNGVPCDTCSACREISTGSNLDVLEIDGASNNGVDQIRDLRDNVKFLPARGPFKIYIIDEVHMLSIGAFNALLKTLEEPPPHVKFIFATTEAHKVPATILSRCQRFDLRRISTGDIAAHLSQIAAAEGIEIDDDAVYALARGAEGGLRDAESALDQVSAFVGRKIVEDDVLQVFGLVSRKKIEDLSSAVLAGDLPTILRIVAEMDALGKDLTRLATEILDYFRNLMVMMHAPDVLDRQEVPETQLQVYRSQVASIDPGRLTRIVDQILLAQGQLKFALSRRIVLEMALIRAARAASVMTLDEAIAALRDSVEGSDDADYAAAPPPPAVRRPEKAPVPVREAPRPPVPPPAREREDAPAPVTETAEGGELALLTNHWSHVCEKVGIMAPLARSYVKDSRPYAMEDQSCSVGCDPEFASNLSYLKHPKCTLAFQKAIADVIGRKVSVHFVVIPAAETVPMPSDTVIPNGDDAAGGGPVPSGAEALALKRKWEEDPSVKRTLELFNGTISDVRQ